MIGFVARRRLPAALTVLLAAGCTMTPATAGKREAPCRPWTVRAVATDIGSVENILDDGRGGMLLSMIEDNKLARLTPDGTLTTVVDDLYVPGGLARRGPWVYVTTGLTLESMQQGIDDGGIERINLRTGERETWATGLVAPNGMALLRDGSAIVTRTISGSGVLSEVTRVPPRNRTEIEPFWSDLTTTNGAALDHSGRWLYLSRSDDPAEIWRIWTRDPQKREKVAEFGEGAADLLDDLTVMRNGTVYVAAWQSGKVYRIDPHGSVCEIASGLPLVTAVEPGKGHGFPRGHLYASSHAGTIYELQPPNG